MNSTVNEIRAIKDGSVDLNDYASRLQKAMALSGFSVADLAGSIGVSTQAIYKVLNRSGSSEMGAINHAKACRAMGVRSDWLALGDGFPIGCKKAA